MKIFTYTISIIAIIIVAFNLTKIDYNNPFNEESIIALITIVAGLCAVLLLTILRVSKKIERLQKRKS
jgi:hypothetical protein